MHVYESVVSLTQTDGRLVAMNLSGEESFTTDALPLPASAAALLQHVSQATGADRSKIKIRRGADLITEESSIEEIESITLSIAT